MFCFIHEYHLNCLLCTADMKNQETGARESGPSEPPCEPASLICVSEEAVAPQQLARADEPVGLDRGGHGPGLSCVRRTVEDGCGDGLLAAQPGGASKAWGSPAGRPGQCEGRAARGQAGTPGTRPRPDTCHTLPAFPAHSPQSSSCHLSHLAPHGFTPLPLSTSGQTPLSAEP